MWSDADNPQASVTKFEPLLDDSITSWAAQLPYPVASALWTMESKSSSPKERLDQAFRVWEAYAIFLASVLLSVCQRDDELAERELAAIRVALNRQHLHTARATMATWRVIIDRLSSTFRSMAASEDDRSRLLQMFGDPVPGTLQRILNSRTSGLLEDVNTARNAWEGHPASFNKSEVEAHLDAIEGLLVELRETVGHAWVNLRLLRPDSARQVQGSLVVEAEVVMGTAVPFRREKVHVGQMMNTGELYLAAEGAATPLPLAPLVQLLPAPAEDRYTCYFYNRLESEDAARYVSYQLASQSELSTSLEPQTAALLRRMSGGS